MAITWQDVVALAPEIPHSNPTEQDRIALFIGYAVSRVSQTKFGSVYDLACSLVAAHMLTLSSTTSGGASPFATRKKIGQVEIQYAAPYNGMIEDYDRTGYGQQFLQLRRERVIPATAVGIDVCLEL